MIRQTLSFAIASGLFLLGCFVIHAQLTATSGRGLLLIGMTLAGTGGVWLFVDFMKPALQRIQGRN